MCVCQNGKTCRKVVTQIICTVRSNRVTKGTTVSNYSIYSTYVSSSYELLSLCVLDVGLSSGTPASTSASDILHTDNEGSSQECDRDRKHDVFISYRRQTGKHLAGSVSMINSLTVGVDNAGWMLQ